LRHKSLLGESTKWPQEPNALWCVRHEGQGYAQKAFNLCLFNGVLFQRFGHSLG
jgi:hypothetical protein